MTKHSLISLREIRTNEHYKPLLKNYIFDLKSNNHKPVRITQKVMPDFDGLGTALPNTAFALFALKLDQPTRLVDVLIKK